MGGATTTYDYNSASNEITNVNGVPTYTHDNNGNMISSVSGANIYTFTYNAENQLTRIDRNAALIASYEYGHDGLRTKKTTPTKTERYYYNGDDLTYVTDGSNNLKYFFIRDTAGKLLQMIDYTAATPKTYWYILDVHGSVIALADSTGNKVLNYKMTIYPIGY